MKMAKKLGFFEKDHIDAILCEAKGEICQTYCIGNYEKNNRELDSL